MLGKSNGQQVLYIRFLSFWFRSLAERCAFVHVTQNNMGL